MANAFSGGGFISNGAWAPMNSGSFFPDPFMDMASLAMPETIQYALRWCEFLMFSNGTYFRALDRVLSYLISDVELFDVEDDDEKQKIYDFLTSPEGVNLLDEVHTAGLNFMVYGNDFSSVLVPFRRYLSCGKCRLELPLKNVYNGPEFKFRWAEFKFHAACPRCGFSGEWPHIDRRAPASGQIKIKHWSPHEMELLWDPYTDDVAYIWKIPDEYRKAVTEGHLFHLERANWEIIECVRDNTHLRFDKDVVYHMRENTLAGVRNRGWGISRVLANFRQAWYVQVLHRYNEAIALDYVIPFRLITPAPGPGSSDQARDALMNMNMGGYMTQVQRMLAQHRSDPAMWHTLPFPVQYQALGGDATQLAPRELMDQGLEILLNNVGVPVELYKGSLQVQSAPSALRLFESSWSHLLYGLNGYIGFVIRKVGQMLDWGHARGKLTKVTHADDIQRQLYKLQLLTSGQVSKQTGLRAIGVDYHDEERRKAEEFKFEAEQQQKTQDDLENASMMQQMAMPPQPGMPGGMPGSQGMQPMPGMGGAGGGAPAGPMAAGAAGVGMPTVPGKPTTPEEMMMKAQTLAQQILTLPESQKDSELIALKKTDPTMHSLVKAQIDDIRRQAQMQGGAMVMQQSFGKQGSVLGDSAGGRSGSGG